MLKSRFLRTTIFIMLVAAIMMSGCRIRPRQRTLPEEIRNIYVPMFINNTSQPGLEELATRASVEAFLADGRLEIVNARNADLIVQAVITEFEDGVTSTESDSFPMMNSVTATVQANLYSPDDRLHPVYVYEPFTVDRTYISDVRRSTVTITDEAREDLMEAVGERLVSEILTGSFEERK